MRAARAAVASQLHYAPSRALKTRQITLGEGCEGRPEAKTLSQVRTASISITSRKRMAPSSHSKRQVSTNIFFALVCVTRGSLGQKVVTRLRRRNRGKPPDRRADARRRLRRLCGVRRPAVTGQNVPRARDTLRKPGRPIGREVARLGRKLPQVMGLTRASAPAVPRGLVQQTPPPEPRERTSESRQQRAVDCWDEG